MTETMTGMALATALRSRTTLVGCFVKTPHPQVIEVLAQSRLDLLCLDAEHAPFDRGALDICILAARASGKPVIVRPPSAAPEHILNALDLGADGVMLPHVDSAAAAEAAARAARFGPGGRGFAGSPRAARYGLRAMAEHRARAGSETSVIAMIEEPAAVEAIEAISAVPGIDALFVGRADLTVAYGHDDPDHAEVIAAVERVCDAARSAGRAVGMFLPTLDAVPAWRARGASLFLMQSDHAFLRDGANRLADALMAGPQR